jgi:hypothetical protein
MTDPRNATDSPPATPAAAPTAADLPLTSSEPVPSSPLVRLGGLLGIAGTLAGLIILVVGCAGYSKAMAVGPIVAGVGALGLVVVLIGAFTQRRRIGEDTHVLQALFACLLSLIGGVLETAVHMKWPIIK